MKLLMTSRNYIVIIVALLVWTTWIISIGPNFAFINMFKNWQIAITMMFGSIIAGATSLGGGSVAFPVLTKLLKISSYDAKVFSLAIQSVGMTAASIVIYVTQIQVDWRIIRWGSLGGIIGIWLGMGILAPLFQPAVVKMSFTLMLTSFAITLLALNRGSTRQCHALLPIWTMKEQLIVLTAGLLGSIMSGLVGNGIDIFVFATMVLLFRISEKVATPTSVVLMAFNALTGFIFQIYIFQDFTNPVLNYWLAAIPVVVLGAPLGAVFCDRLSRQTIADILIVLIGIELLSSLLLIELGPSGVYCSIGVLATSSYINYKMYCTQTYALT